MRVRESMMLALVVTLVVGVAGACSRKPATSAREYLESGDRYAAQGKYPEAVIQFRNAVAIDPQSGDARLKLADAYAARGDVQNAGKEYIRAASLLPNNVTAQVRAGRAHIFAGELNEAKDRAVAALEKEPRNPDALLLLATVMAGLKDIEGAISQVRLAIDADPLNTLSYANLGVLQVAAGDRAAAEDAFKSAIEAAPRSAQAHLELGNFYWATSRADEAERELKAALALDQKSAVANRAVATFYLTHNRRTEAEPYLKAFADLSTDIDGKLTLADYYIVENRVPDATKVLDAVAATKDGYVFARLRIAAVHYALGRKDDAYRVIDEALQREPRNVDALTEKARFLLSDQQTEKALAAAKSATEANPGSAPAHYVMGVALRQTRAYQDAMTEFRRVVEIAPNAASALTHLAELSIMMGDTGGANKYAMDAVRSDPRSIPTHLVFAKTLLQAGRLTTAETELKALEKVAPQSADVQTLLGRLHGAKREYPAAREAFRKALQIKPGSISALSGLVAVDLAQSQPGAAREQVEARLASAKDDADLLLLAGDTYVSAGDMKRAEEAYNKVLQVSPSNVTAYTALATLYARQQRLDDARAQLERAIKLQPKPVAELTMLGTILELQNKGDEARKQYERAIELDPRTPVAANNLAWFLAERNENLDQALQLAQGAKAQLPNDPRISDTLGWIFYKKGLASLAISSLKDAAKQAPRDPGIHYRLGLAYLQNDEQKEARQSLETSLRLGPTSPNAGEAKRVLGTLKG